MKILFILGLITYLILVIVSIIKKRKERKEFNYDYSKSNESKIQKR